MGRPAFGQFLCDGRKCLGQPFQAREDAALVGGGNGVEEALIDAAEADGDDVDAGLVAPLRAIDRQALVGPDAIGQYKLILGAGDRGHGVERLVEWMRPITVAH